MKKYKHILNLIISILFLFFIYNSYKLGISAAEKNWLEIVKGAFIIMLSIYLHIAIHELGHLFFGILNGYKFIAYSIKPISIIKENNQLKIKSFLLPGALGQCILDPPEPVNGKIPYRAYNWGGVIFNIVFSIIALIIYIFSNNIFILYFVIVGLYFAATNGIPIDNMLIPNDARNILEISKHEKGSLGLYIQLKVYKLMTNGVRLTDIPNTLIYPPKDDELTNFILSPIPLNYMSKLMIKGEFTQAKQYGLDLLDKNINLVELHNIIFRLELVYLHIIENDFSKIDDLIDQHSIDIIKNIVVQPSIPRGLYAYFNLYKKDKDEALKYSKLFDKSIKEYIFQQEVPNELMLYEKLLEKEE